MGQRKKYYLCKVENNCMVSDTDKKKLQNMNFTESFKTFFSNELKNYIIKATRENDSDLTMTDLNVFIGILIFFIV